MIARPFMKWAGGKTQLLMPLLAAFPAGFGRYWEPFVGGGAVYFALSPQRATLADINQELIGAYQVVQTRVEELIAKLAPLSWDERTYYRMRALEPDRLGEVSRAARVVYLNRSCYNGLYRVNLEGRFNVPFGRNRPPGDRLPELLRAAAAALRGVKLICGSAFGLAGRIRRGDLVYFDPPYHPVSPSASFVAYSRPPFGREAQAMLAATFARLAARGVHVVLSNSDTPFIRELYRGYRITPMAARRAINCRPGRRGPVGEVIVTAS